MRGEMGEKRYLHQMGRYEIETKIASMKNGQVLCGKLGGRISATSIIKFLEIIAPLAWSAVLAEIEEPWVRPHRQTPSREG